MPLIDDVPAGAWWRIAEEATGDDGAALDAVRAEQFVRMYASLSSLPSAIWDEQFEAKEFEEQPWLERLITVARGYGVAI